MDTQDPVEEILGKLDKVKQYRDRWMARCPAHPDDHNSLSIRRGDDGRVLIKCFARCATQDIMAAVGLPMSALFVQDKSTDSIIATYDYRDKGGVLVYQAVRRFPKGFSQRRHTGNGSWVWNLEGVEPLLYRLPELLAAPMERIVFVVEGEKDVDRLSLYRATATTNSGGAGKWSPVLSQYLMGRKVVLLPDNDNPGRTHMQEVANSLAVVAASVRVVQLPGLPEKGDMSDWLDAGNKLPSVLELINQAPVWKIGDTIPEPDVGGTQAHPWTPIPLSALVQRGIDTEWLWRGYLAPGQVTLFTGLWKAGKTTLLAYLLQSMGGGVTHFVGHPVSECNALVISEENERYWIERRDNLHLGDHIHLICQPFTINPSNTEWGALVQYVRELVVSQGYGLVVFDSLPNLWSVHNENDNAEVKAAVMHVNQLTKAGAAVLLVGHPSKSDAPVGRGARGAGSLSGFADILVEMKFHSEKEDDNLRVLYGLGRPMEVVRKNTIMFDREQGYTTYDTISLGNIVFRSHGGKEKP